MKTDFIVIGSGLAGLTSSLILSHFGEVLLITKGKLSDGSTNWAQGGIACVTQESDSWKSHLEDTLNAGANHNDQQVVKFLVKNAPVAIDWLSKQGVVFEKIKGKFKTGREGGHSFNRIIHATDFTGKEIELALTKRVKKDRNIEIWEYAFAMNLLIRDEICYGVNILSSRVPQNGTWRSRQAGLLRCYTSRNDIVDCFSRAVVLSTGGLGQIYQWTTNPAVSTGDGYALAYQAGAKLKDMEFIQFHPTALKNGVSPLFLLSEALRGEGAYLKKTNNKEQITKNKIDGERFMGDYDQRMELAPRDIVARAIFNEQQKGYEIYLDIRHKSEEFLKKRFPNIYRELEKRGFDLEKDLIPVTPAAHFSCGGVETDLYGRTNIKNLFAFGEVACTGVHGANRLASNSLLEAVVFPLRLEKCISKLLSEPMSSRVPKNGTWRSLKIASSSTRNDNFDLHNLRKELQQLMWEKVGIVRKRKDLLKAKKQLDKWEKELKDLDYSDRKLLELKNMILAARLITQAAIKRKKSLGAHFIDC